MSTWVWVAWHLRGACTWEAFLAMTIRQRTLLARRLSAMIEEYNKEGGGPRT